MPDQSGGRLLVFERHTRLSIEVVVSLSTPLGDCSTVIQQTVYSNLLRGRSQFLNPLSSKSNPHSQGKGTVW